MFVEGAGARRRHVHGRKLQQLLLDHPERLLSATVFATSVLGGAGPDGNAPATFAETDPALLELWQHLADPREREAEIAWRVEHWRLLNGGLLPFDAEQFRAMEQRVVDHAGRHDNAAAHARADQRGLDRGAELARVELPTLVVEAPADRSTHRRRQRGWQPPCPAPSSSACPGWAMHFRAPSWRRWLRPPARPGRCRPLTGHRSNRRDRPVCRVSRERHGQRHERMLVRKHARQYRRDGARGGRGVRRVVSPGVRRASGSRGRVRHSTSV